GADRESRAYPRSFRGGGRVYRQPSGPGAGGPLNTCALPAAHPPGGGGGRAARAEGGGGRARVWSAARRAGDGDACVGTEMRGIAEKVVAEYPVRALAAVHRVGDLVVGDLAVVVGVSCPHRGEAFEACRRLIDDLKHEVPIWKHQKFSDGTEEWVGAGAC